MMASPQLLPVYTNERLRAFDDDELLIIESGVMLASALCVWQRASNIKNSNLKKEISIEKARRLAGRAKK